MRGARNRMAVAAVAASSLLWGGFTTSAPAAEVSTATLDTVRSVGGYRVRYQAVATEAEAAGFDQVTASCEASTDGSWVAIETGLRARCYIHDALRATDMPLAPYSQITSFGVGLVTGVANLPPDGVYFLCMGASVESGGQKIVGPDVCTPFTSTFSAPDVTKVVPGLVLPDDVPNVAGTAVIAGDEPMGPYGGRYIAATQRVQADAASGDAYLSSCSMTHNAQGGVQASTSCWLFDAATGEKISVSYPAADGPVLATGGSVVTVPSGRSYELCMQGFMKEAAGSEYSGPVRCERVTAS